MATLTTDNFGFLIAYLLPGFILLGGLRSHLPLAQIWLAVPEAGAPTVGGFLYSTLASTAAGLLVSALRWAVLDRIYHRTGIREPHWDFGKLAGCLDTFEGLVANHYRFYQAYSNSLVAIVVAYSGQLVASHRWPGQLPQVDLVFLVIVLILVLASRDCLRKYYARTSDLLVNRTS